MSELQSATQLLPEHSKTITEHIDAYTNAGTAIAFKGISNFTREVAADCGFDNAFASGIGDHLVQNFSRARTTRREAALVAVDSLAQFSRVLPTPPKKARGFTYLPLDTMQPRQHMVSAVDNATYLTSLVGTAFFTDTAGHDNYYRGSIGHGFSIAAKGGSGAGTVSLDLAIESDRYGDFRDRLNPSHELWRVGIDTAIMDDRDGQVRVGRIIRTGTALKPGDDQKKAEFQRFRSEFGTLPQRILTFAAAQLMYDQGFGKGLALSTQGGLDLSTLKRSQGNRTTYSSLHYAMGFHGHHNPHWLSASHLQERFYELFVAPGKEFGILPHEPKAIDSVIDGFNNMVNYPSEQPFPIKLCQDSSRAEITKAVASYLSLQGRYEKR